MFATLNDDPDTLAHILQWGKEHGNSLGSLLRDQECCPLEYACLRNHNRCINILCKYEYEIELHEEDKNIIEKVLKEPDSARNDYHFYRKFLVGDRHVDQFYQGACFLKLIRSRKRKEVDADPVERFIKFKAFANPHYIASHFVEKCKPDGGLEGENFRMCDPIREEFIKVWTSVFMIFFLHGDLVGGLSGLSYIK